MVDKPWTNAFLREVMRGFLGRRALATEVAKPARAASRARSDRVATSYNRPLLVIPMNPSVLRILDANLNRAREALRVMEDYARFALNDQAIAASLKEIRHELVAATAGFVENGVLHRDTPGDVGTANKTASEHVRHDVAHVVTAAGKRLGEA